MGYVILNRFMQYKDRRIEYTMATVRVTGLYIRMLPETQLVFNPLTTSHIQRDIYPDDN